MLRKVGDKVKITANTGGGLFGHGFEIGEKVKIIHVYDDHYGAENIDGEVWYIDDEECELA